MRTPLFLTPLVAIALSAAAASSQATASAAPPAARPRPAALPADSFALARKYTQWFYAQQLDSLVAHHPADIRKDASLATSLANSFKGLTEHAGAELWVSDERFITRNGQRQYWRTATFTAFQEPILVRWVINAKGEITGLGLGPKSDAPPIDPEQ